MPRLQHKPSHEEESLNTPTQPPSHPHQHHLPTSPQHPDLTCNLNSLLTSLRTLLFSLLITTPPTLGPNQISADLAMRHRMLSLGSNPPFADDLVEPSVLSGGLACPAYLYVWDDKRRESQNAFISYLSRPPVELGVEKVDVEKTALGFFLKRMKAMQLAQEGERDPVDVRDYELLCIPSWHKTEGVGRVLVRFPIGVGGVGGRLYLMITIGERGEGVKVDNLFALRDGEGEEVIKRLHTLTESCLGSAEGKGKQRGISTEPAEEEEEGGGAEYINDANDFWAGFSDDDEQEQVQNSTNTSGGVAIGEKSELLKQDQQKAIQDIIREAFTLHTSSLPDKGIDAKDSFVDLVLRTIS